MSVRVRLGSANMLGWVSSLTFFIIANTKTNLPLASQVAVKIPYLVTLYSYYGSDFLINKICVSFSLLSNNWVTMLNSVNYPSNNGALMPQTNIGLGFNGVVF